MFYSKNLRLEWKDNDAEYFLEILNEYKHPYNKLQVIIWMLFIRFWIEYDPFVVANNWAYWIFNYKETSKTKYNFWDELNDKPSNIFSFSIEVNTKYN